MHSWANCGHWGTKIPKSPTWSESESRSEDSLRPHELYSLWNSPGQNSGVGSLSLLQEIFPTEGSNPGLPHCRQILCQLSHKGSQRGELGAKAGSCECPLHTTNPGLTPSLTPNKEAAQCPALGGSREGNLLLVLSSSAAAGPQRSLAWISSWPLISFYWLKRPSTLVRNTVLKPSENAQQALGAC